MNNQRTELIEKIRSANNILVTVSKNPSVDQLASCIGLTLLINKLNKHGTAVFSGVIPSTLDFLQPDETIEKNTDSLRDFIIALDKNKADKLRYKQENDQVKIYITPYKTSINESDLEFSKGDFNVEMVIALGVSLKEDLDQAITSHGRILHDATVATISVLNTSDLGTINFVNNESSSLSELITELSFELGENLLDNQIATALLTGIVASTDRFSNDKTTSNTLSIGSKLMAAGANQQLVVNKLSQNQNNTKSVSKQEKQDDKPDDKNKPNDNSSNFGDLSIQHNEDSKTSINNPSKSNSDIVANLEEANEIGSKSDIDLFSVTSKSKTDLPTAKFMTEPPAINNPITANASPESLDPSIDPLSGNYLSSLSTPSTDVDMTLPPVINTETNEGQTLTTNNVLPISSSENDNSPQNKIDEARDEVSKALLDDKSEQRLEPIKALNAKPLVELSHIESDKNDSEISIDQNTGEVIAKSEVKDDGVKPHELRIEPLHDLTKKNLLSDENLTDINDNSPPPVPPPIPMQFNTNP